MTSRSTKLYTLILIRQEGRVLLGYKKRGFGVGKWNGFGGKVEAGESIEAAAHRELQEESSLTCDSLTKVGVLHFEFEGNPVIMEVHVFTADSFRGTPIETEEMRPEWFGLDAIPYDQMWLDDLYWWPYLLRGDKFRGHFLYRGHDTIISYQIQQEIDM